MEEEIRILCDTIRQTSFDIHCYLRAGHLEKVYENALANRLRKLGISVQQQFPLAVFDEEGSLLGEFVADLFVEGKMIIELKAAKNLTDAHVAQVIAYLRASRIEHGMLINFGANSLQLRKLIVNEPR